PLALPWLGGRLAPEGGLYAVLDTGDVQAVARRSRRIDLALELRHVAAPIDEGARHAADRQNGAQHAGGRAAQDVYVLAEHFDHDLAVDLRDALEHVVADRLREARLDAGD